MVGGLKLAAYLLIFGDKQPNRRLDFNHFKTNKMKTTNTKARLLSIVSLVVMLIFSACQQQDEIKPASQASAQLVDEQGTGKKNTSNARLLDVIGIFVPAIPICDNDYTIYAKGTGSYCAPAGKPTAIKLATEYLDDNGNVIGGSVKWIYQCVQPDVIYEQINEHMDQFHTSVKIRFYARFYYGGPTAAPYAWRFTGDEVYTSVAWLTWSGHCGE